MRLYTGERDDPTHYIYRIWNRDVWNVYRIEYVGRTINLRSRIGAHAINKILRWKGKVEICFDTKDFEEAKKQEKFWIKESCIEAAKNGYKIKNYQGIEILKEIAKIKNPE